MLDKVRYEYKKVQVLRGTGGKALQKLIDDGWELVDQESGALRKTLRVRRARSAVGWLRVGGVAAGVTALVAVITLGSILEKDPTEPSGQRAADGSGDADSGAPDVSPITVENNEEFAALLAGPASGDRIEEFADKYAGETVEFDGSVLMIYTADYDSDDILIRAGTPGSLSGPRWALSEYDPYGRVDAFSGLRKGQWVRVTGQVGLYEHDISQDTFTEETDLMLVHLIEGTVEAH